MQALHAGMSPWLWGKNLSRTRNGGGEEKTADVCSASLFAPPYILPWGFQLPPGHSASTRLGHHIVRDLLGLASLPRTWGCSFLGSAGRSPVGRSHAQSGTVHMAKLLAPSRSSKASDKGPQRRSWPLASPWQKAFERGRFFPVRGKKVAHMVGSLRETVVFWGEGPHPSEALPSALWTYPLQGDDHVVHTSQCLPISTQVCPELRSRQCAWLKMTVVTWAHSRGTHEQQVLWALSNSSNNILFPDLTHLSKPETPGLRAIAEPLWNGMDDCPGLL